MAVNTSAKRDDILVDVLYVYKTVDSYNGKLRAILHSIGRDGEWDKRLALGNPASDKSVWLVTAEKLKAQVTPKQATPFLR